MGVVTEIGELTYSKAGQPMKACVLTGVDNVGLRVMFHGAWATEDEIQVGCKVAVFYAISQAGIQEAPGHYWVYDEAFVLVLGPVQSSPPTDAVMEIPTEAEV
eukprot:s4502_g7.t1